ncbi:hypothetical protein GCM10010442_75960 [Kitasatospora kifunensis]
MAEPVGGSAVGVLVLAGSSGRIETDRCRLLARTGMAALSIRWFGGEGQPAGICEIPEILLVAGGDDEMWPSLVFAQELASRRASAGRTAKVISTADAGHRPRLPGEGPAASSHRFRYGGTAEADADLGAKAWPDIVGVLAGPVVLGS